MPLLPERVGDRIENLFSFVKDNINFGGWLSVVFDKDCTRLEIPIFSFLWPTCFRFSLLG